jgi:hypothetical protein
MSERLKWPLQLDPAGRLATVEQDSDDDIRQCVEAILRYRVGDRFDRPEMGMADPTFEELPIDLAAIREVLDRHELRAHVLLTGGDELLDELTAEIRAEWERNTTVEDERA